MIAYIGNTEKVNCFIHLRGSLVEENGTDRVLIEGLPKDPEPGCYAITIIGKKETTIGYLDLWRTDDGIIEGTVIKYDERK